MRKNIYIVNLLILLLIVICACDKITESRLNLPDYIYYNSFESAADTAGWEGNGWISFEQNPSPDGGKQSLRAAGGCIIPHVQLDIEKQPEDGNYILQGWIKVLQNSGGVNLHIADSTKNIHIYSQDTIWTFYQSDDTLLCPNDLNMTLEFMSGGIIPGGMLVDQIAVKKVD